MIPHSRRGSTVVLALAAIACAKEVPVTEVAGSCAATFGAQVCTWAHMKGDSLLDIGATIPLASIDSAPTPATPDMSWPPKAAAVLDVPTAAQAGSGMTEFTMYWEPGGHPPAAFMTPHFDFHFYLIPLAERTAIDCADTTKPAALPAGYALPDQPLPPDVAKMIGTSTLVGICVPQMGMHALMASELQDTVPFRGDMVVGYYHGKPIFIEPMISRTMLGEKKSFDLNVPDIPGLTATYPRTFHAVWDDAKQSYSFTWSDFRAGS
jgi:hypothetical protein